MTQPNDEARNTKLNEILSYFQREQEKVEVAGSKKIAEAEAVQASVRDRIKAAPVGSPEYFQLSRFQDSLNRTIERQLDLMINATFHYILALQTAMTAQTILERQGPTLAEEVERMTEELRKTINDQIAKKVSGLFSEEGHEAMYGHA